MARTGMMVEPELVLNPLVSGLLGEVLATPERLSAMVEALGSPLNVVVPEQIAKNAAEYRAVYDSHRLSGGIYFAHKANRSGALIRELAAGQCGVDVSSLGELRHALAAGFTGERIIATGPKDAEFLWLAARVGAVVNADSRAELTELAAIVTRFGLPPVRVMIRLSAFDSPGVPILSRPSRFGVHAREFPTVLDVLEEHRAALRLLGVAYHLDTTGVEEKALALEGCLLAMHQALERGFAPTAVDIGGGFGVNYLADRGEWERYTTELGAAVLGVRPPITWQNHGYGLQANAGTLRGTLGVYPAYREIAGARYLDELLNRESARLGRPLATLLLENLYDLHIEPGRGLVDQCGLTLARVAEVRTTHGGDVLVRLAANSRDISAEDHAVLMDPVLLPKRPGEPTGVYLAGNLCLEDDLITRRKVTLPRTPVPGDVLAFVNTAGYFMDFAADNALMQPIARTVAAYRDADGWSWCLDEQYWPGKGSRS
ncbi:Y4yA family PLP-dependent enzyme [Nocardia sp. CDC159]|uniref:Y4yA family PLP-dependent enzyme n=1 Tax=Nocardia pulmonis TaxID=2951408 RepID=A0A9X2IZV4_9NOCA|nr:MULTISPECIES: Y4yA family PLP-dependent enzyme [Nocardia]MCM6775361.1 Y4yA family PLP-dependent enzyme [Nocardia pulmonis]MCM6787905.1 Y4yA family PLP-dependent enzyme [Nocardia sp. CDC159]